MPIKINEIYLTKYFQNEIREQQMNYIEPEYKIWKIFYI